MAFSDTNMIRALSSRNYRLFFTGQGISLIGTWMQSIAMSWLVYRLTGSTLLLGVIGFASQIPSIVFSPIAGVMADRWNRHHILIGTQVLAMIRAFITAGLTLAGVITVWQLIFLSFFLGLVNAFDLPARQSLVVLMVEKKEDLPNAIALNSFLFNGARLVGPTIAGILIAILSEGMCFLINGVSYMDTFGFLITASGVGAVIGAIYLAVRKSVEGLGNLLPIAMGIFGIGLIALSQSRVFWLSLPLMLLTGFGMMVQMASNNTILQTIVDDDKRGRVMSLYTTSFLGVAPLGSLLAGALASRVGAPDTIMSGGIVCLLAAMLFAGKVSVIKEEIRRQAYR